MRTALRWSLWLVGVPTVLAAMVVGSVVLALTVGPILVELGR